MAIGRYPGTDFAAHTVLAARRRCRAQGCATITVFADLAAAFYRTLREHVLPGLNTSSTWQA
eukprot:11135840-Lingulodinium_polyedra.AAC.1